MQDDSGAFRHITDPIVVGPVMAFVLSMLDWLYDERKPKKLRGFVRSFIGALMCGFMTVAFYSAAVVLVPFSKENAPYVASFIGGCTAFIGVKATKAMTRALLEKYFGIKIE